MRAKDFMAMVSGLAFTAAVLGGAAWLLGLGDVARNAILEVSWPEMIAGGFCLVWLFVLLKAPWDLFFQAQAVVDEMASSREGGIRVDETREAYVRRLRGRLLLVALGAHALSAAVSAGIAIFGGGVIGWWFAAFYLISTAFRPAVSAYRHLMRRLRQLFEEARFPRQDVLEMRGRVERHEGEIPALRDRIDHLERDLARETASRESEDRVLRGNVEATAREMEKSLSRLTDNQEVVRGIQAFVRLVSHTSRSS
jgi:hypothetical protein